jgi:hypothetical protein
MRMKYGSLSDICCMCVGDGERDGHREVSARVVRLGDAKSPSVVG